MTYHSFRRTANTLLKKEGVPIDAQCQMVGHDLDHVNEFYGEQFPVAKLAKTVVPKFVYKGLDLSGQFDEAIRLGYASAAEENRERQVKKRMLMEARAAEKQPPDRTDSAQA